jgi:hypothetical protein
MRTYEAQLAAYQAWRAKFVAAWEAYHERGKEAAKLFERLHTNVQMRGRVELELSEPEHLQSLFREAISEVSKTNPDLGILRLITPFVSSEPPPAKEWNYNPRPDESLKEKYNWQQMWSATGEPVNHRQVHPVISHNLPELAYLFDDARLEAVVDLLPQVPGIAVEGTENRKEPPRPAFPDAPANIIFSQQDANGYSAPVPPERVTWS